MNPLDAKSTPAEQQARGLATSLDAAAEELDRGSPVPPAEVRRALLTAMESARDVD